MKTENDFLLWHKEKYKISSEVFNNLYFKEREIWFCYLGCNIGYEEDGKGERFLRPIIIIKKINKNMFIGVPLTTSSKNRSNRFYYEFNYIREIKSYAILSQIRCFDYKRLAYKSGRMSIVNFVEIKQKIKDLIL